MGTIFDVERFRNEQRKRDAEVKRKKRKESEARKRREERERKKEQRQQEQRQQKEQRKRERKKEREERERKRLEDLERGLDSKEQREEREREADEQRHQQAREIEADAIAAGDAEALLELGESQKFFGSNYSLLNAQIAGARVLLGHVLANVPAIRTYMAALLSWGAAGDLAAPELGGSGLFKIVDEDDEEIEGASVKPLLLSDPGGQAYAESVWNSVLISEGPEFFGYAEGDWDGYSELQKLEAASVAMGGGTSTLPGSPWPETAFDWGYAVMLGAYYQALRLVDLSDPPEPGENGYIDEWAKVKRWKESAGR